MRHGSDLPTGRHDGGIGSTGVGRSWRGPVLPLALTLALAVAVWVVCRPGILSADSIDQIRQGLEWRFHDLHPPLMAAVIGLALRAGVSVSGLMLIQCALGFLGVYTLARSLLRRTAGSPRAAWLGFGVTTLLALPWSPMPFYLMTLWKDSWMAIALLWLGSFFLARRLVGLLLLGIAIGLLRHNAFVLLPAAALLVWQTAAALGFRRRLAAALACLPLVASPLLGRALTVGLDVRAIHPESQPMALELVGLCVRDATRCAELPWTRANLRDPTLGARYVAGDFARIAYVDPLPVDPALRKNFPALRAEYFSALRRFPLALAALKLEAFWNLLGFERTLYFVHHGITPNTLGLAPSKRWSGLRDAWGGLLVQVSESPLWRWAGAVHGVWLAAALGLTLSFWRRGARHHRDEPSPGVLLALPLAYFASFLPAVNGLDFRFLYPATLFVQVVCAALAFGSVNRSSERASFM